MTLIERIAALSAILGRNPAFYSFLPFHSVTQHPVFNRKLQPHHKPALQGVAISSLWKVAYRADSKQAGLTCSRATCNVTPASSAKDPSLRLSGPPGGTM